MRTRARRIAVRVSEEQFNKICRLTDRSFFTKEQVLRDIILGYPIQEKRSPECIELIMMLRKIASKLSNLNRNYGLSDFPIGNEIEQTSDIVAEKEDFLAKAVEYYGKHLQRQKDRGAR